MAPTQALRLALVALVALSAVHAASHGPKDRANKPVLERRAAVPEGPPSPSYGFGDWLHYCVGGLEVLLVFACLTSADGTLPGSLLGALFSRRSKYTRCLVALGLVFALEWAAHLLAPLAHVSAGVMILASVLFTINPVEEAGRPLALSMGTVPLACILWLCGVGVISQADVVRGLYGSVSLRPYHLLVMFTGSVYLCTALERSGFLHACAHKFVDRYGRSPWGLFWALGCFSGVMTVVIPDDIVTMTMTPVTIRMCQLLNLPELPFLFSQFFAGNIWAVTLVTGNPTNVLLAEDLGDSFMSFARRMGLPGTAAGLTSFALMFWTNRHKVNVVAEHRRIGDGHGLLDARGRPAASLATLRSPATSPEEGGLAEEAALKANEGYSSEGGSGLEGESGDGSASTVDEHGDATTFTAQGGFCLVRLLAASAFCALDSLHGLPVYLCVLLIGLGALALDLLADLHRGVGVAHGFAADVLRHMPWELLAFVGAFLVLAEAMAVTGISLWLAQVFMPLVSSRKVAFISGFTTMVFCNIFETLPATLVVFKMIDSVPQWKPAAIAAAGAVMGPRYSDARRAALSAVIFGSNFGANTSCIGSLGGLMMRRLAAQQGVKVTNGMLLKQGIPVMIPVMWVACFVLIQQEHI